MERTLNLYYDEVVIGADLSALSYSLVNKCPLIYIRQIKAYEYGFIENPEEQNDLYNQILFRLAFNGYCPLTNKVQSIRLEDDNNLKIATKSNHLVNIKYKKIAISDDYKVEGLPERIGKTNYNNCVIDHMGVDEKIRLDPITYRQENVIKTVYYPNKYVHKVRSKQVIINSIITDEELKQIEFSESYMRLRMRRIYEPNILEFKHFKREIFSLGKNLYMPTENLAMITEDYKEILNREHRKDNYFSYIENKWNK